MSFNLKRIDTNIRAFFKEPSLERAYDRIYWSIMHQVRESSSLSDVTFVVNIDACNTELESDERTEGINAVLSLLHRSNAVIHSLVRERYKLYDISVIPLLLFSLSLPSLFPICSLSFPSRHYHYSHRYLSHERTSFSTYSCTTYDVVPSVKWLNLLRCPMQSLESLIKRARLVRIAQTQATTTHVPLRAART